MRAAGAGLCALALLAACAQVPTAPQPSPAPPAAAQPPAPVAPATGGPPRLPPTPEIIALPGGNRIPPPPGARPPIATGPAPGAGAGGEALPVTPMRGVIPPPPRLPDPPSEADGCLIPPAAVTAEVRANRPPVLLDQPRAALTAAFGATAAERLAGRFSHVAGAYRARNAGPRMRTHVLAAANGCLVPTVRLDLQVERTIMIAAEYPPGSCRHRVALAHEWEHAAIDDAMFAAFDAWIAAPLRLVLAEPGALRDTPQGLAERLNARFQPAVRAFAEARMRAQLSIDTAEEYRRLTLACPG